MANIATGFVRLFPKKTYLPIGDILTLLCAWNGRSYHVPIFVRQDEFSFVTDIQFGDRWRAIHGIDDVWEKYHADLIALWWRDFDDGGDHDLIGWIDETGPGQVRRCRYGYDKLQITWKPGKLVDDFGLAWDKQGVQWTLALRGSYRAGNNRCALSVARKAMPTSTTLAGERPSNHPFDDIDAFDPLLPGLQKACEENADTIKFFWKERLVRIQRPSQPSVIAGRTYCEDFCMDDWDNCVDENWLVFNDVTFTPDHIG